MSRPSRPVFFRGEFWIVLICVSAGAGIFLRLPGRILEEPQWVTLGEWLTRPLVVFGLILLAVLVVGVLSQSREPNSMDKIVQPESKDL